MTSHYDPPGAMPHGGNEDEQAPDELQTSIAETRAELAATVDAIQERLSPDHLKAQAQDAVQDAADQARTMIRDATVGKAEEAFSGAARTARGMSESMIETIKQNPIPAAMVGIGLGWLFFKQQSNSSQTRTSTYGYRDRWAGSNVPHFDRYDDRYGERYSGRYGQGYGGSRKDLDEGQGTVSQAMNGVQDRAGQFMDQAQSMAGQVADQAQSMAGQVADQAQATAGQAFDMVQQGTQQVTGTVQGQFQQMMRDNPLALGGLAVAAGLAVGLAIPGTDKEDELLGDARDSVMQQAKEAAQDAQQKLQQVAQEAGHAAQQEAKEQHLTA